jgi:carbon-monoxide dehydrogenase medium subunit
VKPPQFDYAAPTSLPEAISLLAENPEAKVLAGGQSLVPLLAFRLAAPSLLVDLARIPGLDAIEAPGGLVTIGAMARQGRVESHAGVANRCPLLIEALRYVAHPQIRSRGTIGGSVAHADPAAEIPAVLLALDGRVHVAGPRGERAIAAQDLFHGYLTTALEPDEILVAIELPDMPERRTGVSCVEVARRAGDYALCGAVCQVTRAAAGVVADARLAFVGVADRPVRATAAERALMDGATPKEAATRAADDMSPSSDVHASAEYRLHVAGVVAERAFAKALERAA